MKKNNELILIPKYERYIEYMLEIILKMPRTEKFNIGNEFKLIMYKVLENILYINKINIEKRLYYLNMIDAELNVQRIMIRIMQKNRWIDNKKYKVSMEMLYEIGKILGGLIKAYGKMDKTTIRPIAIRTMALASHSNTNFRLYILRNIYSKSISIKEICSFRKR